MGLKSLFSSKSLALFSLLICYFIILTTVRFIAWPEMLVWPYLTQHGFNYYTNIISVYPPLLLRTLQLIASLHWDLLTLKLTTWIILGLTTIITGSTVYSFTKSSTKTFISLLFFIIWQLRFEGNGLWFDHLLAPLFFLTFISLRHQKPILASLFFALSLLTKQTSLYLLIPIIFTITNTRNIILFLFSTFNYTILGILLIVPVSHLPSFFHTIFNIGILHLPNHPDQIQWPTLKQLLIVSIPFLTVAILSSRAQRSNLNFPSKALILWIIFSSLGIFTRFELFHLQPALPFLTLLLALHLPTSINRKSAQLLTTLILLNSLIFFHFLSKNIFQSPRFLEPEITTFTQQLKTTINSNSIYTYNTWDHFYFLLDQPPPINLIYPNVPMFLEYPGFQNQTVYLLTQSLPTYILTQNSTLSTPAIDNFVQQHYQLILYHPPFFLYQHQ